MKIALSGYYGFDNAGDEALLSAITTTIKKFNPDVNFVVFSGSPQKTTRLHGLYAINRINPLAVIRELLHSDLLISGGGSLFQDITGPFSLPYYISIVTLAKILKKPVFYYAQGIGPINRKFSKILLKYISNRVNMITLRDEASLQVLNDLGISRPPIKVTADPVFTLEASARVQKDIQELLLSYSLPEHMLLGVSVRNWPALEGYQEVLARVLDFLAAQGYSIVFIPMSYPDDIRESQLLLSLMKTEGILIKQNLSSLEHIALISHLDLMIGMRLHSLIFSAASGIPFAGISYDPKIDAFLKSFDSEPLNIDYQDMLEKIDFLLHDKTKQEIIKNKSLEMKKRAEETALLALSLLKE